MLGLSLLIVHILELLFFQLLTIFTWLDATATITLVSKIGTATIQTQPLFDGEFQSGCVVKALTNIFHAGVDR